MQLALRCSGATEHVDVAGEDQAYQSGAKLAAPTGTASGSCSRNWVQGAALAG